MKKDFPKKSGLAIASTFISLIGILLYISCIVFYRYEDHGYTDGKGYPIIGWREELIIDIGLLYSVLLFLISTLIGIIGILKQQKYRLMTLISLFISISMLLLFCASIIWKTPFYWGLWK